MSRRWKIGVVVHVVTQGPVAITVKGTRLLREKSNWPGDRVVEN